MSKIIVTDFQEAKQTIINYWKDTEYINQDFLDWDIQEIINVDQLSLLHLKYSYFFRQYTNEFGEWTIFDEPLAYLIGKNYRINFNNFTEQFLDKISYTISGNKKYLSNEEIIVLCPEIVKLKELSIEARKLFIGLVRQVNKNSRLVDYEELFKRKGLINSEVYKAALNELIGSNLLTRKLAYKNILNEINREKLMTFAYQQKFETKQAKYETIETILKNISDKKIEKFFREELGPIEKYLQIELEAIRELKDFIWSEDSLINMYLEDNYSYIRDKNYSSQYKTYFDDKEYAEKEMKALKEWEENKKNIFQRFLDRQDNTKGEQSLNSISYTFNKNLKPWANIDWQKARTNLSDEEIALIRNYWTKEMDEEIIKLYEKYAWDSSGFFKDMFTNQLENNKIEKFKIECETKKTHAWYNMPKYFGEFRIIEMKIPLREAKIKICRHCKNKFLESSVHIPYYKEAINNLDEMNFCDDCYSKAFFKKRLTQRIISRDELIKHLQNLWEKTETIPTRYFVDNPKAIYKNKKTDETIIALIKLPPIDNYISEFGSWFKALAAAGIIEDETIQTPRGYRCIARDGHECYSLAEKFIDDWFTDNNIAHEKEVNYPYDENLNPYGMRVDWKVSNIFIEFAGLSGDPAYDDRIQKKKTLAQKNKIDLIILELEDLLNLEAKLGKFRINDNIAY